MISAVLEPRTKQVRALHLRVRAVEQIQLCPATIERDDAKAGELREDSSR